MLTGCVTELVVSVGNCSILLGTSGHHVEHASALSHQDRGSGSMYALALALLAWGLTMASVSELKVVSGTCRGRSQGLIYHPVQRSSTQALFFIFIILLVSM